MEEKGQDAPAEKGQSAHKYKVVLLGNQGVGKTSLLQYFLNGIFSEEYVVSVSVLPA